MLTEVGNRCDACSDVDDANQSAPESTCGYMERNCVSLRPSREEDKGKQLSPFSMGVEERGREQKEAPSLPAEGGARQQLVDSQFGQNVAK